MPNAPRDLPADPIVDLFTSQILRELGAVLNGLLEPAGGSGRRPAVPGAELLARAVAVRAAALRAERVENSRTQWQDYLDRRSAGSRALFACPPAYEHLRCFRERLLAQPERVDQFHRHFPGLAIGQARLLGQLQPGCPTGRRQPRLIYGDGTVITSRFKARGLLVHAPGASAAHAQMYDRVLNEPGVRALLGGLRLQPVSARRPSPTRVRRRRGLRR